MGDKKKANIKSLQKNKINLNKLFYLRCKGFNNKDISLSLNVSRLAVQYHTDKFKLLNDEDFKKILEINGVSFDNYLDLETQKLEIERLNNILNKLNNFYEKLNKDYCNGQNYFNSEKVLIPLTKILNK